MQPNSLSSFAEVATTFVPQLLPIFLTSWDIFSDEFFSSSHLQVRYLEEYVISPVDQDRADCLIVGAENFHHYGPKIA